MQRDTSKPHSTSGSSIHHNRMPSKHAKPRAEICCAVAQECIDSTSWDASKISKPSPSDHVKNILTSSDASKISKTGNHDKSVLKCSNSSKISKTKGHHKDIQTSSDALKISKTRYREKNVLTSSDASKISKTRNHDKDVLTSDSLDTSKMISDDLSENGTNPACSSLTQGFSRSSVNADALAILAYKNSPLKSRQHHARMISQPYRKPLGSATALLSREVPLLFMSPCTLTQTPKPDPHLTHATTDLLHFAESKI